MRRDVVTVKRMNGFVQCKVSGHVWLHISYVMAKETAVMGKCLDHMFEPYFVSYLPLETHHHCRCHRVIISIIIITGTTDSSGIWPLLGFLTIHLKPQLLFSSFWHFLKDSQQLSFDMTRLSTLCPTPKLEVQTSIYMSLQGGPAISTSTAELEILTS